MNKLIFVFKGQVKVFRVFERAELEILSEYFFRLECDILYIILFKRRFYEILYLFSNGFLMFIHKALLKTNGVVPVSNL